MQDNYNNTHKTTTTIHTRQLQQYTQDNYKNTHKTTTTIHARQLTTTHTRQLQQYTQDNCNNTHKTINNNTRKTLTIFLIVYFQFFACSAVFHPSTNRAVKRVVKQNVLKGRKSERLVSLEINDKQRVSPLLEGTSKKNTLSWLQVRTK